MLTVSAPAFARHRDNNGVDADDIFVGAIILGSIAAMTASSIAAFVRCANRIRWGQESVQSVQLNATLGPLAVFCL